MMSKRALATTVLIGLAAAAAYAFAQDKGAPPSKPAPGGQAKPAASDPTMAKMMEYATPGANHRVLDGMVGKWNVDVKTTEQPGATPTTSKAISEMKWILDGHFIQETAEGTFMDQPFHGMWTTGYDNLKKKYVMSGVDNMGTGIGYAEGTWDAASKTFTWTGECPDPAAGKYVHSRTSLKQVDNDHWTLQAFKPGTDGKEFMTMEINYTRAK